jgi:transcriptional regulator with XRE-family HTH domain
MNEFKEVTPADLRAIRSKKGMNQEEIGELLGITQTAVSKIEKGSRGLSESEKALLDWYFFGILPPRIATTATLQGCLEFTDQEWHVLGRMAARVGQTQAQFITGTIRRDIQRHPYWQDETAIHLLNKAAEEEPDLSNYGKKIPGGN